MAFANTSQSKFDAKYIVTVFLALIFYTIANNRLISFWYYELSGPIKSAMFFGYLITGFLVAYITIRVLPWIASYIFGLLACISTTTEIALKYISKMELNPATATWLVSEMDQLPNAMSEFNFTIIKALITGGMSWFLFVYFSRRYLLNIKSRYVSWVILVFFFIYHGIAGAYTPKGLSETSLYVFGIPALLKTPPVPSEVNLIPKKNTELEKIILIVDESIRPDFFQKVLHEQILSVNSIDYGIGNSTANCSAASNSFLRWGLDPSKIGKAGYDPRSNSTIWKFATCAGYRTVLFDGQTRGKPQNFIRTAELKLINEFIPSDVGIDTDASIARMLVKRIQMPGKEFIYIVKRGVHWPYQNNYPESLNKEISTREARYEQAIQYSTGQFFNILFQKGVPSNTAILYTSDHGQQFSKEGGTHCRGDYTLEEYQVPIMAFIGASTVRHALEVQSESWYNKASHLQIHATALTLMGYGVDEVREIRATPLDSERPEKAEGLKFVGSLPFPIKISQSLPFSRY